MTDVERGQIAAAAATVYDEFFVPALFQPWAPRVAAAARVAPGQRVLDVATGTGVLARTVRQLVGPNGSVAGVDINDAMLDVARHAAPENDWRTAAAEDLPFPAADFDAVVSQFGLMFFDDRAAALCEMRRVLRVDGRAAVAVWAAIDESPGYAALAEVLSDLFGPDAAESLRGPFAMGDSALIVELFDQAGFRGPAVSRERGTVTFPSMNAWMFTEIRGWTLAGTIDDRGFDRLTAEADARLGQFRQADGRVQFPITALVATATA